MPTTPKKPVGVSAKSSAPTSKMPLPSQVKPITAKTVSTPTPTPKPAPVIHKPTMEELVAKVHASVEAPVVKPRPTFSYPDDTGSRYMLVIRYKDGKKVTSPMPTSDRLFDYLSGIVWGNVNYVGITRI